MIRGVLCPCCGAKFSFLDAPNRKFSWSGEVDCPACAKQLEYPQRLQSPVFYLKTFGLLIAFFVGVVFLGFYDERLLIFITPFLAWFAMWFLKSFGLKDGYIPMVERRNGSR